jgi:DHA1 family bicyclomycin/chloramphenicol resistance-like MFS transporter
MLVRRLYSARFAQARKTSSVESTPSHRFVIVLGLLTGLVAFAIDISLPAIPDMVADLATTMSAGQQVVGLFMAGMALGQIPFGLVSDRIGRIPVLYAGIGLFTTAGIITSISNDISVLLVARFIQGVGAASGMVLARAIVRDVSSGAQSARLLSLMVMVFTAAPMVAPVIGAFLVDSWGWRMPFAATAIAGAFVFLGIWTSLHETLQPRPQKHVIHQLAHATRVFFSYRQSVFGVIIIMITITGIMSLIAGASALAIEIYKVPVRWFGILFALTGVAILAGSAINRRLLQRFDALQIIGIGAVVSGLSGLQLLLMIWIGDPPFWWLWGNACLYMFAIAFMGPNATALALDPVPEIAGTASSIMGTIQSVAGAASAIINSALYTGTILNVALILGLTGIALPLFYLARYRSVSTAIHESS